MIVRQSKHLITNLHLGGWRGEVDAVKQLVGERAWQAVVDVCRRTGAVVKHWHLGIDVAVSRAGDVWVLEINAFGDLLPRLQMHGLDVYGVEIASLLPNHADRVLHSI